VANAGSAQAPACSLESGVGFAKLNNKPLIVVTGVPIPVLTIIYSSVTILGKNGAIIMPVVGGDGIFIRSGDVYLRNLTVQGSVSDSTGIGIKAEPETGAAVNLHMDTCAVINNPGGGILLNGSAFDIRNTTVNGNGPGQTIGGTPWGGIRVDALPSSGTTNLNLANINTNNPSGLSCAGSILGTGVLSTGNTSIQISTSCGVTACTPASATCGAQSQPQ
jgi:hypothetical protein